jgi:hypothetical protein
MRRHLVVAGRGIAGIGLASGLGYLTATKASNAHHPPGWPYLICAGFLIIGIVVYLIGEARPRPDQEEEATQEGAALDSNRHEASPVFTSHWRSTSDGLDVGSLMRMDSTAFSHKGFISRADEKPPSVRIGSLIACDPLGSVVAGTELRSRFRAFLAQQAIMSFVAEMTHVGPEEKWVSLAGNGPIMLEASLMAENQETAPVASAMFLPSIAGQSLYGRDPRCAELRLYIEPRTADGSPAPPMKLVDWQARFARALAIPRLLAGFLSHDLGLATSDDPHARFGILLEAPGPLTELIDIGGLRPLPGNFARNQFVGWAIADPGGSPTAVIAREFMTQVCEHALNLDDYEWALSPVDT